MLQNKNMVNILIVYAVEEERVLLKMSDCKFHYCKTGVGKIAAAIAVQQSIELHHPDIVINIGTAGTLKYELGSIHLCCKFIDRDMEKLSNFGIPFKEDFTEEVKKSSFFKNWSFDSICNTGDTFLTSADGTGDVFDMESFAVARICRTQEIPFVGVKCVTDIIGQNSIQHWEEKLADAQAKLQQFVDENPIYIPKNYIGRIASNLINELELEKHPEGGWYKEMYRSNLSIKKDGLPDSFNGDRNAITSIFYMLCDTEFSSFHKIKSPETWYFHKGMNLVIHIIFPGGEYKKVILSDKKDRILQYTVEPNCWFAAELEDAYGYTLVSCAVAPGFHFKDFELAKADNMMMKYPKNKKLIARLCIN